MNLHPTQLRELLPPRQFWFVSDIAKVYGVGKRAVQYCASRNKIGRKVRGAKYGIWVFTEEDLESLTKHLYGEVGNPDFKKRVNRNRMELNK